MTAQKHIILLILFWVFLIATGTPKAFAQEEHCHDNQQMNVQLECERHCMPSLPATATLLPVSHLVPDEVVTVLVDQVDQLQTDDIWKPPRNLEIQ